MRSSSNEVMGWNLYAIVFSAMFAQEKEPGEK